MAVYLYSIEGAVDGKYIVTKTMTGQAKAGTLVHIMDGSEDDNGISVSYRVTATEQDFTINFPSLKQFCKWAQPNDFLARHYEKLTREDILFYLKANNRSVLSFCVPLIAVALIVIWAALVLLAPALNTGTIILGAGLSVAAAIIIVLIHRLQKKKSKDNVYNKVCQSWGVVIK